VTSFLQKTVIKLMKREKRSTYFIINFLSSFISPLIFPPCLDFHTRKKILPGTSVSLTPKIKDHAKEKNWPIFETKLYNQFWPFKTISNSFEFFPSLTSQFIFFFSVFPRSTHSTKLLKPLFSLKVWSQFLQ